MQNTNASLCQTVIVLLASDGALVEIARTVSRDAAINLARKLAPVLGSLVVLSVDGRIYTVRSGEV